MSRVVLSMAAGLVLAAIGGGLWLVDSPQADESPTPPTAVVVSDAVVGEGPPLAPTLRHKPGSSVELQAGPDAVHLAGDTVPLVTTHIENGEVLVPDDGVAGLVVEQPGLRSDHGMSIVTAHVDAIPDALYPDTTFGRALLREVAVGDLVRIDRRGVAYSYVVERVTDVPRLNPPDWLWRDEGPRAVALVTCSGLDPSTGVHQTNRVAVLRPD